MILGERGGVIIAAPSRTPRGLDVAEPDAGRRKRENSRRDAMFVHGVKGFLRSPVDPCRVDLAARSEAIIIFRDIKRRRDVLVDVYQSGLCRRGLRNTWRAAYNRGRGYGQSSCGDARKKLSSANIYGVWTNWRRRPSRH
jgi:hypothetical protein